MIPVGRLAPGDQWDQNMLDLLFANDLYPTGLDFTRVEGYPNTEGCVLIVPGRYWHQHTDQISTAIQRYEWVLGIRSGDEEDQFDIHKVTHPNILWWVQTPRTDRDYGDARLFGVGFPPHFNDLPVEPPEKGTDVFCSAQCTHARRVECFDWLGKLPTSVTATVRATEQFTSGFPPYEYVQIMTGTKIAPCPSGPASPDTFRVYEALEAHAVPIADDITPAYDSEGYWEMVLPGAPMPVVQDYRYMPSHVRRVLSDWPDASNRLTAWWMRYKRQMALWLREDLDALGIMVGRWPD